MYPEIHIISKLTEYLHICNFITTMKHLFSLLFLLSIISCTTTPTEKTASDKPAKTTKDSAVAIAPREKADASTILAKKQVPVLCYHDIRSLRANEGKHLLEYIVPEQNFKAQMKMLADSGYHTISPNQYYDYLLTGAPLPAKPIMITFDDTDLEQYTVGAVEMEKYGFKGVFFIMTISIGRPRYMSKEQIKDLADKGHTIAAHTWDHHRVDRYKYENTIEERGVKKVVNDWDQQALKTKLKLEEITGKPVEHFAYPFGIWDKKAFPELEKRGYKSAYQLSDKRDSLAPLYTLRRMIVPGTWDVAKMDKWMKINFK